MSTTTPLDQYMHWTYPDGFFWTATEEQLYAQLVYRDQGKEVVPVHPAIVQAILKERARKAQETT